MFSFNMLPPTTSIKNHTTPSNQGQTAANAPEPSSDDSQRILPGMRPEKDTVDLRKQAFNTQISSVPLFDQQSQMVHDRSQTQEAMGKRSYQEAIKAYKEKAGEIREAAENIENQGNSSNKEAKNLLQIMQENNQVNHRNLITYRRSAAQFHHTPPSSSSPSPADPKGDNNMQVALYNQAITAYITQNLFFSSISKIGLLTTA